MVCFLNSMWVITAALFSFTNSSWGTKPPASHFSLFSRSQDSEEMCRNLHALKLGICWIIPENRRSDKRVKENDCEFSRVKLRLQNRQKEWRSREVVIRKRRCFNKSRRSCLSGCSGRSTGSCKIYICTVWKGSGTFYFGTMKIFLMLLTHLWFYMLHLETWTGPDIICSLHGDYPCRILSSDKVRIKERNDRAIFAYIYIFVSISIGGLILLRKGRRIYFNFFLEAY